VDPRRGPDGARTRDDQYQQLAGAQAVGGGGRGCDPATPRLEASALRTGFQPQLGLTPGQRLGLEHVPFRDAAMAANAQQAAAMARHLNALEGGQSNKRVKHSFVAAALLLRGCSATVSARSLPSSRALCVEATMMRPRCRTGSRFPEPRPPSEPALGEWQGA
jgi:hypothetical protein